MENERLAFWRVVDGAIDERAIRRYAKKHAKEVLHCFKNLAVLVERLNGGVTLQQALTFGFFGSEGEDVYRIGQERKGMRETRLYIHAMIVGGEIRVLTIGDKDTQSRDVGWCHEWVRGFRNSQSVEVDTQKTLEPERGEKGE